MTIDLSDSHTHLEDYGPELPAIVQRARDAGVGRIITAGSSVQSSRAAIRIAESYPDVYAGVGIHPMQAHDPVDEATFEELEALAKDSSKVVCISEVGLDFLPSSPDHAIQYQVFREHIRLARSLKLPIIFHSRESHPQVFQTLREEGADEVGGVMHYFQGDEATARQAIDGGFFISLARPLLRLPELQETAKAIPLENIVLETDAAPQPFKAKRESWTEPRHLHAIVRKLAELQRKPVEEVEDAVLRNVERLLGARWGAVHRSLVI